MNTVSESTFVAALGLLTSMLKLREKLGLKQIIAPKCIGRLSIITKNIDERNVLKMCALCTKILNTLGEVHDDRSKDNVESLRAIKYYLETMYNNSLGSHDEILRNLDYVLKEKSQDIARMAEALKR